VLIAEQALVNARQSLIVAQHDKVVASYSLLSAVGRLSAQTLGLLVPIYDPWCITSRFATVGSDCALRAGNSRSLRRDLTGALQAAANSLRATPF
jgi:hypothetical protein